MNALVGQRALNTQKYSRDVCGEVLGDKWDKGWLVFIGKWSSALTADGTK